MKAFGGSRRLFGCLVGPRTSDDKPRTSSNTTNDDSLAKEEKDDGMCEQYVRGQRRIADQPSSAMVVMIEVGEVR